MKYDEFNSVFCGNIKYIRTKYELSQKEMAHRCGISLYTLRKLEQGIIPPKLGVEILYNIFYNFGILPGEMFKPL